MTYAFHTPDKLCFILDLMNGGDLHYHLSQVEWGSRGQEVSLEISLEVSARVSRGQVVKRLGGWKVKKSERQKVRNSRGQEVKRSES